MRQLGLLSAQHPALSTRAAPRRILIIKLGGLGETLTITPALRALRETFAEARIDALVSAIGAQALAGTGLVDDLIDGPWTVDRGPWTMRAGPLTSTRGASAAVGGLPFTVHGLRSTVRLGRSLRRRGYDRIVVFHHLLTRREAHRLALLTLIAGGRRAGLDNGRGWFLQDKATDFGFGARHEVEYWLDVTRQIGATTADLKLAVGRSPDADLAAESLLTGLDRPRVAIHAGSGAVSPARRWPLERFAAVAQRLQDVFGAEIVLLGGAAEQDLNAELAAQIDRPVRDLTGRTDVPTLAGVLARCDVLLANDSGVMHVGAAVGLPTVAVFGPSNHESWRPWTGLREEEPAETPSGLTMSLSAATVVRSDIACSPCFYVAKDLGTPQGCAARTCLDEVTPAQVGQAVSRYLGARKRALTRQ